MPVRTAITRLALLGTDPSAMRRHGLQTAALTSPTVSRSPACSTATGMPCARATRSTCVGRLGRLADRADQQLPHRASRRRRR